MDMKKIVFLLLLLHWSLPIMGSEMVDDGGADDTALEALFTAFDEDECKKKAEELLIFAWVLFWRAKTSDALTVTYEENYHENLLRIILELPVGSSVSRRSCAPLAGKNPFYVVRQDDLDVELLCGCINGFFSNDADAQQELRTMWELDEDRITIPVLLEKRSRYLDRPFY